MKLYAAVIEWPEADPELILSRTAVERFAAVRQAVADMLDAFVPEHAPQVRAAVASEGARAAESLGDWVTVLHDTDDGPWITTYEREL